MTREQFESEIIATDCDARMTEKGIQVLRPVFFHKNKPELFLVKIAGDWFACEQTGNFIRFERKPAEVAPPPSPKTFQEARQMVADANRRSLSERQASNRAMNSVEQPQTALALAMANARREHATNISR